jgi:hypothetical protein
MSETVLRICYSSGLAEKDESTGKITKELKDIKKEWER